MEIRMLYFLFGVYVGVYLGQEFKDLPNIKKLTVETYEMFSNKQKTEHQNETQSQSSLLDYAREYFSKQKKD